MIQARRGSLDAPQIAEAAQMIRVLGHPVRLRIVEVLQKGERCVSEIQRELAAPQAVVSQQLARMRAAGIVRCRRDGVNVRYSINDDRVLRMLDCLRHCEVPARRPRSGGNQL
jgi:ArsR family transcriptional regulator